MTGYLPPANWVLANAILYLVVIQISHPRTAVDRYDAFHDVAIAGLYDFDTRWLRVYVAHVNGWLGLAVCFGPGAVLRRVDFKVLGSHHVLGTELAGTPAAYGTYSDIDVDIARLLWSGPSHKDLLMGWRALVCA